MEPESYAYSLLVSVATVAVLLAVFWMLAN